MPTITTGYDFGATEVPTFDKMMLQASGVEVSGLGLDDLPATLLAMVTGTTSGSTGASLPSEGWMWYAPDGTIYVESRWFLDDLPSADSGVTEEQLPVPLFRPQGGWASVRFRHHANGSEVGNNLTTAERHDNDERYHTWAETNANFSQDGGRCLGLADDTGVSGSRGVMIGRGPAAIRDLGFPTDGFQNDRRAFMNASNAWASLQYFESDVAAGGRYCIADAMGRSLRRGTNGVASLGNWWLFSGVVYGP